MPVSAVHFPVPSTFSVTCTSVSFVVRLTEATRPVSVVAVPSAEVVAEEVVDEEAELVEKECVLETIARKINGQL